jgi:hypothetical protein
MRNLLRERPETAMNLESSAGDAIKWNESPTMRASRIGFKSIGHQADSAFLPRDTDKVVRKLTKYDHQIDKVHFDDKQSD